MRSLVICSALFAWGLLVVGGIRVAGVGHLTLDNIFDTTNPKAIFLYIPAVALMFGAFLLVLHGLLKKLADPVIYLYLSSIGPFLVFYIKNI